MSGEDSTFWEYNYPVQLWRYEDHDDIDPELNGKAYCVIYVPRKGLCFDYSEDCEFIPEEELPRFCNKAIDKFKTAIELFEKFRDGEIDHVYYWDRPKEIK